MSPLESTVVYYVGEIGQNLVVACHGPLPLFLPLTLGVFWGVIRAAVGRKHIRLYWSYVPSSTHFCAFSEEMSPDIVLALRKSSTMVPESELPKSRIDIVDILNIEKGNLKKEQNSLVHVRLEMSSIWSSKRMNN